MRSFALCIEGVRDLTETQDGCYLALFETKVAFMHFKINVAVEIARIKKPNFIEAKIEGQLLGIVGRLNAASSTSSSNGESRRAQTWHASFGTEHDSKPWSATYSVRAALL
jgi:carbon monoxide dehydrogenase subunit G